MWWLNYHLSWSMTKLTKWFCALWRLWSAWASAQPNQSLLCTQWVAKDPRLLHAHSKDLTRLGEYPGWSESLLGAQVILLVLSCSCSFWLFSTYSLRKIDCSFCLICGYTSQSTTTVMSRRSVNLTTLFLGRLPKRLTSTKCPSFCQ